MHFFLLFGGRLRMNMRDVTCRVSQGNFCSALTARDHLSKTRRRRIEGFCGEGRFKFYEKSRIVFLGGNCRTVNLPFQAFIWSKICLIERIVLFLCLCPPPFSSNAWGGVAPVFLIPRPFRESTHFVLPYTQVQRRKRKIRLGDESLDKEFFFCFSSWGG